MGYGGGYDHNFVINKENDVGINLAAYVIDPKSGRRMDISLRNLEFNFMVVILWMDLI